MIISAYQETNHHWYPEAWVWGRVSVLRAVQCDALGNTGHLWYVVLPRRGRRVERMHFKTRPTSLLLSSFGDIIRRINGAIPDTILQLIVIGWKDLPGDSAGLGIWPWGTILQLAAIGWKAELLWEPKVTFWVASFMGVLSKDDGKE